jgi:WD40 repeat protein
MTGHRGDVLSVALTPDDKRCISVSEDGTLRVWDVSTGRQIGILESRHEAGDEVAFSPDGRLCVFSCKDNTVGVWDLQKARENQVLRGLSAAVSGVAVTRDSRKCVSASWVGELVLWDMASGRTLRVIESFLDGVQSLVLAAERERCVFSFRGGLVIWDFENSEELRVLQDHDSGAVCLPLAMNDDGHESVDPFHEKSLQTRSPSYYGVSVSPDGKYAVSASSDDSLRLWDLEAGVVLARFQSESPLFACVLSPDGSSVVAGGTQGAVHFFRRIGDLAWSPIE